MAQGPASAPNLKNSRRSGSPVLRLSRLCTVSQLGVPQPMPTTGMSNASQIGGWGVYLSEYRGANQISPLRPLPRHRKQDKCRAHRAHRASSPPQVSAATERSILDTRHRRLRAPSLLQGWLQLQQHWAFRAFSAKRCSLLRPAISSLPSGRSASAWSRK